MKICAVSCCLFDYLIIIEILFFSAATIVICKLFVRVGQDHARCVNGMCSFCRILLLLKPVCLLSSVIFQITKTVKMKNNGLRGHIQKKKKNLA